MITNISKEIAEALHASDGHGLEVIDPVTERRYVLVESETCRQAIEALRREQDRKVIAAGLAQMEAGEGMPLDEVFTGLRTRLGFPQPE